MRIERWWWLAIFCIVSFGIHLGVVSRSRSFGSFTPPPKPVEIEVALEAPPEPKPAAQRAKSSEPPEASNADMPGDGEPRRGWWQRTFG
jgi:hypothetical protein